MPAYRIYFIDQGAHISKPPVILECADNEEAIQQAYQYVDGQDLELWREGTLVATFNKKEKRRSSWLGRSRNRSGGDDDSTIGGN